MIAFRIERLPVVGSTNDVVRERADRGEPEGLVVLAERQAAGRGRHGRVWQSPPGNLYVSLLLRPHRPTTELASLSLVIGLSLADTLAELAAGRFRPQLKWPNDLLVDGAKLAGVLLETSLAGEAAPVVVAGMGVNITNSPTGTDYPATCLAALGVELTADALLQAFLLRFAADYAGWQEAGFAALRERWLARAQGLGETVRVRVGQSLVEGRLASLDPAGRLVLETARGRRLLDAGELFFERAKSVPC